MGLVSSVRYGCNVTVIRLSDVQVAGITVYAKPLGVTKIVAVSLKVVDH